MTYSLHSATVADKLPQAVRVEALQRVISRSALDPVLAQFGARVQRERKLTLELVLWFLISFHLFARKSFPHAFAALVHHARLVSADPTVLLPSSSALVYRRYQIGVQPLVALFRAVCRPIATPQTPGAFRFGLRVVVVDGSLDNLCQTATNAAVFTRKASQRGRSAFPQVLGVYLMEAATHVIFDVGFWPGTTSEHRVVPRLLRSITAEMLVLWDRGFHSFALLHQVRQRGAHVIGRLPAQVRPLLRQALPDGSWLAELRDPATRQAGMRVRIVAYRVTTAPTSPVIRLVTTLLDPHQAPAMTIAAVYHERWEGELVFDELGTHLALAEQTLRSQHPVGVLQELYGLLLAHYVIRVLMQEAALQAGLPPSRLSFTHAVELVRAAIGDFQVVAPADWERLYHDLVRAIARGRLPVRQIRSTPRTVCRSRSKYKQKPPGQHSGPRAGPSTVAFLLLVSPLASTSHRLI